jgi:hypothetical protein
MAEDKARKMALATMREIDATVEYVVNKVQVVERLIPEHPERLKMLRESLFLAASGLSRHEAKIISRKFFTSPSLSNRPNSISRQASALDDSMKIEHYSHHDSMVDAHLSTRSGDGRITFADAPVESYLEEEFEDEDKGLGLDLHAVAAGNGESSAKSTGRDGPSPAPPTTRQNTSKSVLKSERAPKERGGSVVTMQGRHGSVATGLPGRHGSVTTTVARDSSASHMKSSKNVSTKFAPSVKEGPHRVSLALNTPQAARVATLTARGSISSPRTPGGGDMSSRGGRGASTIAVTKGPEGYMVRRAHTLTFSEEDLRKAILDTRTATIVKGLLDEKVHGNVYDTVLTAIQREEAALQARATELGIRAPPPGTLTVKAVVDALENEPRLRISRPQTMGIIAMSDCYDKTGTLLRIVPFAEYVSDILTIMRTEEGVESRTRAMSSVAFDEHALARSGKRPDEAEIVEYLTQEFSGGGPYVSRERLVHALKRLPYFRLRCAVYVCVCVRVRVCVVVGVCGVCVCVCRCECMFFCYATHV